MKKFNEFNKVNESYDDNQDVIFADIQSDIENMPQDEVNDYLDSIISFCQEMKN